MNRCLRIALFAFGLALCAAESIAAPVSQEVFEAQKENIQLRLENLEKLRQKDTETLKQRIDDVLTETAQSVDRFGVLVTCFAVLIGLAGFVGYRNAKAEAKAEAKAAAVEEAGDTAKDASKEWFDDNAEQLKAEMEHLRKEAGQAHVEIVAKVKSVEDHSLAVKAAMDRQQAGMGQGRATTQSPEDTALITEQAKVVAEKPESTYTFADWHTRAHAAVAEKQWEDAAYFWLKAAQIAGVADEDIAESLFNRGVAQSRLNQLEEAIATFDGVIRRFGNAPEAGLRELVAGAFNGIGFTKLCQAKEIWQGDKPKAIGLLDEARQFLDQGVVRSPESNGIILGNRAYVRYLRGDEVGAEEDFRAALLSKEGGGEKLYQETCGDFEISPIPEDAGMRELVERLWQEWSQPNPP